MPDAGTLLTQAFTGRAEIPVEGATVSVLKKTPSGKFKLLAVRVTDDSGHITSIPIPTPLPEKSRTPGQDTPFSVCDLWVEHPDYQTMVVENIQLFPGIESRQPLPLLPLSETKSNYLKVNRVDVTAQPL